MRRGWWLIAPALLLGAAACRHHQNDDGSEVTAVRAPVTVEVTNNFALPVEIVVVANNSSRRLGTVHPGMKAHFVIPQVLLGNSSVLLEGHASSTTQVARSAPLLLSPGAVVDFLIDSVLFNSTATIREP